MKKLKIILMVLIFATLMLMLIYLTPQLEKKSGNVVLSNEKDFNEVLKSSKKAFNEWSNTTPLKRSRNF